MRYAIYATLIIVAALLVAAPVMAADARDVRTYRTEGNLNYQVLEAKEVYIYSLDVIVRKGAGEKQYFFSVGANGDIFPLTILNLKKAFPDNHAFHDDLDMFFKNDSQLTKYDEFHKMFKVNRLLEATKQ